MSSFPCLVRLVSGSGQVRYRLGERLVDRYLEFVAGRCRPNTLRAVAFDLKAFFTVTGKDSVQVTVADVFEFLAAQRGDRAVVRLADRFFGELGAYLHGERPAAAATDWVFVVLKGPRRGLPLSAEGLERAGTSRKQSPFIVRGYRR